ncbi:MAG: hypothetical protein JO108_04945 [Acidobacteriaceae bacterium]|nr:hypothetical protein [Acidobacteriaceae bacterium]
MLFRTANTILIALLVTTIARAQEEHHHDEGAATPPSLGTVSFPISCSAEDQSDFTHGMALLHSFGYKNARLTFQQINRRDPSCAMAYWGQAMSLYRQLWDRPSAEDLAEGAKLIQEAESQSIQTKRERAYIDAAAAFYEGNTRRNFDTRRSAYSDAMKKVHTSWPDDDEASLFYALSLLTSPDAAKNNFAITRQAIAILKDVFQRSPNHPGAAHYLIHACDNPVLAADGLAAARRYAEIAPASPHAVHMPSHIFARLGMWDEDIKSNLASMQLAKQQKSFPDMLHAMNFLEYAYLQKGNLDQAKQVETDALNVPREDFVDMPSMFNYVRVRFPSLYLLETHDWIAAQALAVPLDAEPRFQAVVYWTRAVASGHRHDPKAAQDAVTNFDAKIDEVRKTSYAYAVDSMTGEQNEAHAWLAFAQGQMQSAINLMTRVAENQDREGKGEVEFPAREMLADMLLEEGSPYEALTQYRLCLRTDPNRLNSLAGAKRAENLISQ